MAIPQISIRSLVFTVSLIAGDCAALRMGLDNSAPYGLMVGLFTILPMSNILAVACYRSLASRTPGRPFFLGFGLSGAAAMLACFYYSMMVDGRKLHDINFHFAKFFNIVNYFIQRHVIYLRDNNIRKIYYAILNITLLVLLTLTPQMFVALSGGWIARRYAARSKPIISSSPPVR
jgi:hypothetical protein